MTIPWKPNLKGYAKTARLDSTRSGSSPWTSEMGISSSTELQVGPYDKQRHTQTHRYRKGARERGSEVRRACCEIMRPEFRSQHPCNKLDKSP